MTWGMVAGAAIGAAGSMIGASKSASGAKDAAKTSAEASDRAAQLNMDMFQQSQAYLDPYRSGGYTAQPLLEYLTTGQMPSLSPAEMQEMQRLQGIGQLQTQAPQTQAPQAQFPQVMTEGQYGQGTDAYNDYLISNGYQNPANVQAQPQATTQPTELTEQQRIRLEQLLGKQNASGIASAGMEGMITNSPMYKYQSEIGNQQLDRKLRAMGRSNSDFGVNTFGDYNRALIAGESDKMYNRIADQANAGMGVARSAGQNAMNAGQTVGSLYQNAGNAQAGGILSSANTMGSLYENLGQGVGQMVSGWGNKTPTYAGQQVPGVSGATYGGSSNYALNSREIIDMPLADKNINLYGQANRGNGGYGEGFLNVLAYQNSLKANQAQQERQQMLDGRYEDETQYNRGRDAKQDAFQQQKSLTAADTSKRERLAQAHTKAITLAQRIDGAPPDLQEQLYNMSSQMMLDEFGDVIPTRDIPQWNQGGRDRIKQLAAMSAPADQNAGVESGYKTYLIANGLKPSAESYQAYNQLVLDQKKAGATNVSISGDSGPQIGTIPPGFEVIQTPTGFRMSKIQGESPVTIEEEALEEKRKGRKRQQMRAGNTVIQDLQRALDIVSTNRSAVGAPSLITQFIPESDAQAAEGMIQSALSNVGLDTLQQMRENSPTGGALGQVPIQQQKRLEQVLGSLNLSQRPEIVQDNLKRVINIYKDIVYGTPEEIAQGIEDGMLDEELVGRYLYRNPLSFDEFGKPVKKKEQNKSGIKFLGFED